VLLEAVLVQPDQGTIFYSAYSISRFLTFTTQLHR